MNVDPEIPIPIRFNPLKHHRNYMLNALASVSPEEIIGLLEPVCNNYNDVYTGALSPTAIGKEIIRILTKEKVLRKDDFARWLQGNNGYRKLSLEDGSEWIVRLGNEDERYIHLHPSRDGKHTVRFKGSSLKTVFLIKALQKGSNEPILLENVNQARLLIGLSPIKKLDRNRGILSCYEKFFQLLL
jgi:hypothetical protein